MKVSEVMTSDVETVRPDQTAQDAAKLHAAAPTRARSRSSTATG